MGIESGRAGGWGSAGSELVRWAADVMTVNGLEIGVWFAVFGRTEMPKCTRIFCAARRHAELPGRRKRSGRWQASRGLAAEYHEVSGGRARGSATGKVSITSMCPVPQRGQSRKDWPVSFWY